MFKILFISLFLFFIQGVSAYVDGSVLDSTDKKIDESAPIKSSTLVQAYCLSVFGTIIPVYGANRIYHYNHDQSSRVPVILTLGGLLVGPSFGQFYERNPAHGFLSLGVRTVGVSLYLVGLSLNSTVQCDFDSLSSTGCGDHDNSGSARPGNLCGWSCLQLNRHCLASSKTSSRS